MRGRKVTKQELEVGKTYIGGNDVSGCWQFDSKIVPFVIDALFENGNVNEMRSLDGAKITFCNCNDLDKLYEWIEEPTKPMQPDNLTPYAPNKNAKELGIDLTREFVVVVKNSVLPIGEVVVLAEDNNSIHFPAFERKNGEFVACPWRYLAYAPQADGTHEPWQPKCGEKVLVWNDGGGKCERTYIATRDGAKRPYICVDSAHEGNYRKEAIFLTALWKHISPLPAKVSLTLEEIETKLGMEKGTLTIKQ